MIGDTVTIEGIEYEIVWAGGEGLIADRETKTIGVWSPPARIYNKTGKHSKKAKEVELVAEEEDDDE